MEGLLTDGLAVVEYFQSLHVPTQTCQYHLWWKGRERQKCGSGTWDVGRGTGLKKLTREDFRALQRIGCTKGV